MKAVVFHALGDIRVDEVPKPKIEADTDAIVRLTASAICGTDLHFIAARWPRLSPVPSSATRDSAWSRASDPLFGGSHY